MFCFFFSFLRSFLLSVFQVFVCEILHVGFQAIWYLVLECFFRTLITLSCLTLRTVFCCYALLQLLLWFLYLNLLCLHYFFSLHLDFYFLRRHIRFVNEHLCGFFFSLSQIWLEFQLLLASFIFNVFSLNIFLFLFFLIQLFKHLALRFFLNFLTLVLAIKLGFESAFFLIGIVLLFFFLSQFLSFFFILVTFAYQLYGFVFFPFFLFFLLFVTICLCISLSFFLKNFP